MTYVIKRKFQGALGDDVESSDMASLVQHIQISTEGIGGLFLNYDTLTLNHLVVKTTNRIPCGTDRYK